MTFILSPYSIFCAISACTAFVVAGMAWRRRTMVCAKSLAALMTAVGVWSAGDTFSYAAVGVPGKVFWFKVAYPGVVCCPVFFLFFALDYSRIDRWLTRQAIGALLVVPAITLVLALTNDHHGLIWSSFAPSPAGMNLIDIGHGSGYWIGAVGYSYLAMLAGTTLLIRHALCLSSPYRKQISLIVFGSFIPWASNFVYVANLSPVPGLELTPLMMVICGIAFALDVFRFRLLDIAPVAHHILVKVMAEGMLVLDANDRVIDCNPAVERLIGISDQQCFGRHVPDILAAWPDWDAHFKDTQTMRAELAMNDAQQRYLEVSVSPINDHWGRLIGRLVVMHDITERKQAEQEIQNFNQILLNRVEEETNRRIAQERLLANNVRLAAMGEMIGAIAHQWRQPLSTLGMIIQRAHAVGSMQCLTQEYLDEFNASAMQQIMHMSETIDDFRSFYRIDKKQVMFSPARCISKAVRLAEQQFVNRGIETEKQFRNFDSLQTLGYPNEFMQVILNLLSNSRDAILKRRETSGQLEAGRIVIDISVRENHSMMIDVKDNGCGIPAEFCTRIFDPYFTTKDESEGTGIGLYMSRMIVEDRLDGRLFLVEGLDGAVFRIELPLRNQS